jgi:hypothetical protein
MGRPGSQTADRPRRAGAGQDAINNPELRKRGRILYALLNIVTSGSALMTNGSVLGTT